MGHTYALQLLQGLVSGIKLGQAIIDEFSVMENEAVEPRHWNQCKRVSGQGDHIMTVREEYSAGN